MNISQLRKDIDTGRTKDKVAYPDPAAAPLGTDEEAAGTPISGAAVERARSQEVMEAGHGPRISALLIFALVVVGAMAILIGFLLLI